MTAMLLTILAVFGGLSFISTAIVLGALLLSAQITHGEEENGIVRSRIGRIKTQPTSRRIDTTPRHEAAF